MLTNCLAECAHLTISEILVENRHFFIPPLHSTPPLGGGGSRGISAIPFGKEKLEWLNYQIVKKFRNIFIRFGATHERDGQTDRHRVTAIAALCIASHCKNWNVDSNHNYHTFSTKYDYTDIHLHKLRQSSSMFYEHHCLLFSD